MDSPTTPHEIDRTRAASRDRPASRRPRSRIGALLADVAAGIVLTLVRPYAPGERIRLAAGPDESPVIAELVRVGARRTLLGAETGLLEVPNRILLTAPARRTN